MDVKCCSTPPESKPSVASNHLLHAAALIILVQRGQSHYVQRPIARFFSVCSCPRRLSGGRGETASHWWIPVRNSGCGSRRAVADHKTQRRCSVYALLNIYWVTQFYFQSFSTALQVYFKLRSCTAQVASS